ncbi:calcium channel flower-like [Panonychus citri]|uniref:calcium channel flower-like n=1 Tax=Panonychus citri TaxID=50023 RepID=UPI002306E3CF|nr:calcium channel flower-like [Panonychus citri]
MMGSESQQGVPAEWWVVSWRNQIVTGLSLLQVVFGIITSLSLFSFIACVPTGLSLVFGAIVVLSIEAPAFVSFIRFAQPITAFFEAKPLWIKVVTYAGLAILPCLFGCYGPFFFFGFFCALGTTAIYGVILIGQKANQDDMRFQAGGFSPA